MFGYVTVDKPEMKVKDFYRYKAYYCGLCKSLQEEYGLKGRMTLTYDVTFLMLVLTSLYEPKEKKSESRCPVHPIKKIPILQNEISKYGAAMNILLTYYHFEDDWKDEKSFTGIAGIHLYQKQARDISRQYPRQSRMIRKQLQKLSEYEQKGETDIDLVAGTFGHLMEELFVLKEDRWEPYLRKFGFFLGKFIYIMDAYDDLEKDLKSGSYNPLKPFYHSYTKEEYEKRVHDMLLMMMAEAGNAFEHLPCVQENQIIKNIIYSGVWAGYNKIQKEKQEKEEKNVQ